jgi:hypothetical protein
VTNERVRVIVEIDTSSPQSLLASILLRWHAGAPHLYRGPKPLAARFSTKPEPVGRDQSFEELRKYMSEVYRSRVVERPSRVPLAATASAPGCGKSRFLDELASAYGRAQLCRSARLDGAGDKFEADLSAQIGRMVVVNITFNSDTLPSGDPRDKGEAAAASRVLFEYVLCRETLDPSWCVRGGF